MLCDGHQIFAVFDRIDSLIQLNAAVSAQVDVRHHLRPLQLRRRGGLPGIPHMAGNGAGNVVVFDHAQDEGFALILRALWLLTQSLGMLLYLRQELVQ
ncbi:hypothetical protein FQZ97_1112450 [compost metagenome]